MTTAFQSIDARPSRFSFESLRMLSISMIFISSFFVKLEPAATDLFSFVAILLFATSGLNFARSFATPLLFMIVYLLAGVLSAMAIERPNIPPYPDNAYTYSLVTAYTSLVSILVAAYVAANPSQRFRQIERAWWIGATIGAIFGLLIYFGFKPLLLLFSSIGSAPNAGYGYRVVSGYKDPNVFSTWMVFPVVSMLQAFLLGRLRITVLSLAAFGLSTLALLLAFSRGAWFDLAAASTLTVGLSILLSPSLRQRRRVLLLSIGVIFLVVILFVGLLSVPSLNAAFLDRFVLVKSYDGGETGRFGNQLNALPLLLRAPLGFGPYQFNAIFGEDPHNTFLNSFASGGWIGGITYLLWIATTFVMGIKTVFTRSPYQVYAIPVVATYLMMTMQGLQIDNEHWRHLYWMMGLIWGLFAAMQHYRTQLPDQTAIRISWGVGPSQK